MTAAKRYAIRGQLRVAWRVTKWRDGCVYKTAELGLIAMQPEHPPTSRNDIIFSGPSTKFLREVLDGNVN